MRPLLFLLIAPAAIANTELFTSLDTNKDGKLSKHETPEEARPYFSIVDQDSDTFISKNEFDKVAPKFAKLAADKSSNSPDFLNMNYAGNENPRQSLDFFRPDKPLTEKLPLVVYIHGGGWMMGSKEQGKPVVDAIISTGDYAAASINYRLIPHATWPAQIFDCKSAIRFLRANAEKFGIDPDRIAVMGKSAGGHLAALLGTTGEVMSLEGKIGEDDKQPSHIQCVINLFGPTDFQNFYGKDVDVAKLRHDKAAVRLLGDTEDEIRKNAPLASPVHWITKGDAPFLTAHGTMDKLVPFSQAEILDEALTKVGVESHLIAMQGAGHGFSSNELNRRIRKFLDLHLRDIPGKVSEAPIKVH